MEENEIKEENVLKAGFARVTVTPPLGLRIPGYYLTRISDGIIDDLHLTAIAFEKGDKKCVMFTCDCIGIKQDAYFIIREMVAQRCGIEKEAIYIACTHSHTSFRITKAEEGTGPNNTFLRWLYQKFCDAAQFAFEDLAPVTSLRHAMGEAKNIAWIRRYLMKDGTCKTNPGVGNPNVERMLDKQDESVQLIRFVREGAKEILLMNFSTHADVIGGTKYCADFPGFAVRTLEGAFGGTVHAAFFNGAEGDSNQVNVFRPKGSPRKGLDISANMGRSIAGECLKLYYNAKIVENTDLRYAIKTVVLPKNDFDPALEAKYRESVEHYRQNGKDDPYFKEPGNIDYVIALRVLGDWDTENFPVTVSAVAIGDIVFNGIPGEPFTVLGFEIKEKSPFPYTVVTCITNGGEGYYPTPDAFKVNGYERNATHFSADCVPLLVKASLELDHELFEQK